MSLTAEVRVRRGTLSVDVRLEIAHGEVVVLLGPNGAGKTTLLRALAGLVSLDGGRVELNGAVLEDVAAGVRVSPERRSVGMLFQDYVLFPHLSALDNVAFGPRARGATRAEARRVAADWLTRVGLADVQRVRPRTLSGGQAQRVALARSLARDPAVLLLDEPLAALDAGARTELRRELRSHLKSFGGTCLVVTHDPVEAVSLADRLVVLEHGRVTQTGSPAEVCAQPRSHYVADLVGLNLFRGEITSGVIRLAEDRHLVAADEGLSGEVFAVVHPRAVVLHRRPPEGSSRNVWQGTPDTLDASGDRVRVRISGSVPLVAEVTAAAVNELELADGGIVWASVKAAEVDVYSA